MNVAYNTAYLHDNMAIRISKVPQWVTVSPASGTVFAGGSFPLSVNFDSEGLLGGYFYANIYVLSNDPDEPTTTIPVTLHVLGAPDIAVDPLAIDFGSLFVGRHGDGEPRGQQPRHRPGGRVQHRLGQPGLHREPRYVLGASAGRPDGGCDLHAFGGGARDRHAYRQQQRSGRAGDCGRASRERAWFRLSSR